MWNTVMLMGLGKKSARKSVASGIMTFFVLLAAASAAVFFLISFMLAKLRVESDSYNTMTNAAAVISGIASDYMNPKISEVENAAADLNTIEFIKSVGNETEYDIVISDPDYNEVSSALNNIAASDKDIISAWIISENGGILIGDNDRYVSGELFNLSGKYWYKSLSVSSKRSICSAAMGSTFDRNVTAVSIIAPVYSNAEIIGYVGADIDSSGLSKIMGQYTLNSGCYPVISSNYGSVIYSPDTIEFRSKFNLSESPLFNIVTQSGSGSEGIDSYSGSSILKGETYYSTDNTSIAGWSIIVLYDSEILNNGIYSFFITEIVVLVCILALMLIVVKNKLDYELAVIPKISEAAEKVSSGDFRCKIEQSDSGTEIKELSDISESIVKIADSMREKVEIIQHYTSKDSLTNLPNRMSLYDKIESLIGEYNFEGASEEKRFAVMFVDVDNFKWLNETLGHNFGDAVLCIFASTLSNALSKYCTVYRFSGDEFIILLEFGNDYGKIHKVIEILQQAFSNPIKVMTDSIYLKFSMGVSIFPDDDITADMLLRDADLALHKAKESGKDRVSFYTNAAKKQLFGKANIAKQVSTALGSNEMYLNYQPIISTESGDIHGFEVLLRWNSPVFGTVPPTEFINVAEETGDIVQIGMWIFENSCRFLKELRDRHRTDIILSVNVSPIQLKREDYIESIKRVIEITQINPANIQLEITESALIEFIDNDKKIIEELNDMGIAIALDDFGTGYSSLNYLKNFPVKCLKIDKSFVDEIGDNEKDQTITDSIIDLVHNLGIKTVAEGIETVGQYNFLRSMKCDYIQGFLMSKPLDENDALEFVEKYEALHKPDSHILAEHEKQLADEKRRMIEKSNTAKSGEIASVLVDGFISK